MRNEGWELCSLEVGAIVRSPATANRWRVVRAWSQQLIPGRALWYGMVEAEPMPKADGSGMTFGTLTVNASQAIYMNERAEARS